ncbi:MAG: sensor domain-containing protein [Nanoarchaeota archaeon]
MDIKRFLMVFFKGSTYQNLVYLLLSFPLGLFYFLFLVLGFAFGLGFTLFWIGIPILIFTLLVWWRFILFERWLAIHLLKVKIPFLDHKKHMGISWVRVKHQLLDRDTHKGFTFIMFKLPLSVITLGGFLAAFCIAAGFIAAPFIYEQIPITIGKFQVTEAGDAMGLSVLGVVFLFVALNISNALANVHRRVVVSMLEYHREIIPVPAAKKTTKKKRKTAVKKKVKKRKKRQEKGAFFQEL